MRFRIILTLDYEIHGNGHGSPRRLMIEPTRRMMALFERYDARLTIMADVAEILRFQRHRDETGTDFFDYRGICGQLREAVEAGHDVQLHLHPSYYKSRFIDGYLEQEFSEYDLPRLPLARLQQIVGEGRRWLEELLCAVDPGYRCIAFRAANWSMNPSSAIVQALVDNGILIDTSVFKYGRRSGLVSFDYADAHSDLVPWPVSSDNVCQRVGRGKLLEFPIYCEEHPAWHFLSTTRVYRLLLGRLYPLPEDQFRPTPPASENGGTSRRPAAGVLARLRRLLLRKHAWKIDFNQCSGRQLTAAVRRIEKRYGGSSETLPIVLIGHSKLFTHINERSLEPFLRFVADNRGTFAFGCFRDFNLERFGLETT
jgi:hypothetical protein